MQLGQLPHLHPAAGDAGLLGDELVFVVDRDPAQLQVWRGVQARSVERAAQPVLDGVAAAREIQPQGTVQDQTLRGRFGDPPAAGDQAQRLAGLEQIGRPGTPGLGQMGLGGIEGWRPFDANDPQGILRLETPDFLGGPGGLGGGQRQGVQRSPMTGGQAERPGSRAQPHPQSTIGFQPGRQWTVQGQRQELRRQRRAEQFLARLAGDAQFQPSRDRERNPVGQQPEDLHVERILLGRRGGPLAQPQPAVLLQPWHRLGPTLDGQVE